MARICRFNDNRLGLREGDRIIDVTPALEVLPSVRWPLPRTDLLIEHLQEVLAAARELVERAPRVEIASAFFHSPVANPPKVIAAPVNYLLHQAEANADGGVHFEKDVKTIAHYGLFLKASTSVIGVSQPVVIRFPERRTDHEIELVAIVGKAGSGIPRARALEHVCGYTLGLDMTLRGPEDRSLRKSLDGFSVLGPWLVTSDEIADPNNLRLELRVNGQTRQQASTRDLIFDVQRLVEYASSHYTLCPGDVIFTGTPAGVGPVRAGDRMHCSIAGIAEVDVHVSSVD